MGAHVSDVPNHQVGRTTPLLMRCHVAMAANLGFELNIDKLSSDDKKVVMEQIKHYHQIKDIVGFGDLFRLLSPFDGMDTAWMYVSTNQERAVVFYYKTLATPNPPFLRLKLRGLKPEEMYKVNKGDPTYLGDELMQIGLTLPLIKRDFFSYIYHIEASER
jgi:alpha-galactosidase